MATIAESDDWRPGPHIAAPEVVARVEAGLARGPLIIEHRHYRGASAPTRLIIEEWEEWTAFTATLQPGDAVYVWPYLEVCSEGNALIQVKAPDARGRVPRGGAH